MVFLEIARRPPEIADESLRCRIWNAKWLPIHSPDKRFDHALLTEGLPGDLTVLQKRAMQGELFDALSDNAPNLGVCRKRETSCMASFPLPQYLRAVALKMAAVPSDSADAPLHK